MTPAFGAEYASAYDDLYADKDYAAECDLIVAAFARYGSPPAGRVLDLGCGTGGHALLLAERGYDVVGVDLSGEMLDRARRKAAERSLTVKLVEGDVRDVDAGGRFDTALLMFAVLSYQLENDDVLATLRNIRRQVEPGGLLLLDAWYGPGVLLDPPQDREKVVETAEGPVRRLAQAELNARRHRCRVSYTLLRGEQQLAREEHDVRFFFPLELELFLEAGGFQLRQLTRFPTLDEEPDDHTWNAFVVAQAV